MKKYTEERWNDHKYCLYAVRKDGNALAHVKYKVLEVCLEAVEQNVDALKHVRSKNMKRKLSLIMNMKG